MKRMRRAEGVACLGNRAGACWVLVGRPEGKKTLVKLRSRWDNIIKMDFKAMGWRGMDWIFCLRTGAVGGRL